MTIRDSVQSDAAAFVYIRSCLMGRAHRFRSKQSAHMQREPATLNAPLRHGEDSSDPLDFVAASDPQYDTNHVTDLVTLQSAMQSLTPHERQIIRALYFDDSKVIQVCNTLQISKNSVLKTRRKALKKLRAALEEPSVAGQEE